MSNIVNLFNNNYVEFNFYKNFLKEILDIIDDKQIYVLFNKDSMDIQIVSYIPNNNYIQLKGYIALGWMSCKKSIEKFYEKKINIFDYFKIQIIEKPFLNYLKSKIEFKKVLTEDQKNILKLFNEGLHKIQTINAPFIFTIKASTGIGKTLIALKIIANFNLKAVIVVHRRSLIQNWINELNEAGISSVGSLKGPKAFIKENELPENDYDENEEIDFEQLNNFDKDVIIVVFPHFKNLNFKNFLINKFSILIIDEIHKINLETNKCVQSLLIYPIFLVTIFLSATAKNMHYFTGYEIEYENNSYYDKYFICVKNFEFNNIKLETDIYLDKSEIKKDRYFIKSISILEKNLKRNLTIFYTLLMVSPYSKTLVLCKHRMHMTLFYNLLKEYNNNNILIADANNAQESQRILQSLYNYNNFILISTIDYLADGINIPTLDNLFLISIKTTENENIQSLGRLQRGNLSIKKYLFLFTETTNNQFRWILNNSINDLKKIAIQKKFQELDFDEYCKNNKVIIDINYNQLPEIINFIKLYLLNTHKKNEPKVLFSNTVHNKLINF